jgi:hypothetical protein
MRFFGIFISTLSLGKMCGLLLIFLCVKMEKPREARKDKF